MTVRKALRDAARWGLLARNVAELADPPSPGRADMRTWTAEELRRFLTHVEGERLAALWMLAASTGSAAARSSAFAGSTSTWSWPG